MLETCTIDGIPYLDHDIDRIGAGLYTTTTVTHPCGCVTICRSAEGGECRYCDTHRPRPARVVNLTPHPVTLTDGARHITIQPSGEARRVVGTSRTTALIELGGAIIPVRSTELGEVVGLPTEEPGTVYIVSRLVAESVRRPDVLVPDDLVRDEHGNIVGARALAQVG